MPPLPPPVADWALLPLAPQADAKMMVPASTTIEVNRLLITVVIASCYTLPIGSIAAILYKSLPEKKIPYCAAKGIVISAV
jgi:hypothetical protein